MYWQQPNNYKGTVYGMYEDIQLIFCFSYLKHIFPSCFILINSWHIINNHRVISKAYLNINMSLDGYCLSAKDNKKTNNRLNRRWSVAFLRGQ